MRRARLSIKPNFRPAGRSGSGAPPPSQPATDEEPLSKNDTAEDSDKASPKPLQEPTVEESSVESGTDSPSEKVPVKVEAMPPPSASSTPVAAQRRMRFSAAPKLTRSKVAAPTPRLSDAKSGSEPSAKPKETPVKTPDSSPACVNTDSPSNAVILDGTAGAQVATKSSVTQAPSLAYCRSVEIPTPSPQPEEVPEQPLEMPTPHECPTPATDIPSACEELQHVDGPHCRDTLADTSSEKERILRALKLKELMKIERRKDAKRTKRGARQQQCFDAVDRSKMTMRDLIYYLPDTSPMKSFQELEESRLDVPPSPKVQEKTPECEEEDEQSENEDFLVPKVRVAEDGSIILDEESLTVRVQRPSNTKVVEDSNPLFERGSTTTYCSFRNFSNVKNWSIRETDMFFLAISMVGTDFSLIGNLFPHRSRKEIKNKFKKEEKINSWRIDEAFRKRRPYDREFFSFLLEKILTKDKEKRKSVKLVMPKKSAQARGKKAKQTCEDSHSDACDDEDEADLGGLEHVGAEKENEDFSNVNENNATATKKPKRKRKASEDQPKEDTPDNQIKKKKKRSRKTAKKTQAAENDTSCEGGPLNSAAAGGNADEEVTVDLTTTQSKGRRSRKKAKQTKEGTTERKGKRRKTSTQVSEESILDEGDLEMATAENPKESKLHEGQPAKKKSAKRRKTLTETQAAENDTSCEGGLLNSAGAGGNADEEVTVDLTTTQSKGRRSRKKAKQTKEGTTGRKSKRRKTSTQVSEESILDEGDLEMATAENPKESKLHEGQPAKKKSAKRRKTLTNNDGTAEDGEPSAAPSELEKLEAVIPAEAEVGAAAAAAAAADVPETSTRCIEKTLPIVTTGQHGKLSKLEVEDSPLENEQLIKQPVILLERTPTRPVEVQRESSEPVSLTASPASTECSPSQKLRMHRADRVKRNLSAAREKVETDGGRSDDELDPGTSAEMMKSPAVLLDTREFEDTEVEDSLNEVLIDLSCLQELNTQATHRRPMVVLSREEVDMILNAQDHAAPGDPSVSACPLDLSLPTELSFQLKSGSLMEGDGEAAQDVELDEEHQMIPSSSIALKESHSQDLGRTEPLLDTSDGSTRADVSSYLDSKGHIFEKRPVVVLHRDQEDMMINAQNEDPSLSPLDLSLDTEFSFQFQSSNLMEENAEAQMGESAVEGDENRTQVDSCSIAVKESNLESGCEDLAEANSATSPLVEEPKTSMLQTPQLDSRLHDSPVASHNVMESSLESVVASPETEQKSVLATPKITDESEESLVMTQEVKDKPESPVRATPTDKVKQEEVRQNASPRTSVSSDALVSSKHDVPPKRRRGFLKPKPNLGLAAKVTHSSRGQKTTESSESVSSVEPDNNRPADDENCDLKDSSNESMPKEKIEPEKASPAAAAAAPFPVSGASSIKKCPSDHVENATNGTQRIFGNMDGHVEAAQVVKSLIGGGEGSQPEVDSCSIAVKENSVRSLTEDLKSTLDQSSSSSAMSISSSVKFNDLVEESKTSVSSTSEPKSHLRGSLVAPNIVVERSEESVVVSPGSEKESLGSGTTTTPNMTDESQESVMATPERKDKPDRPIAKAPDSVMQEDVGQPVSPRTDSSEALAFSKHGVPPKMRSRFLKPKPNLCSAPKFPHGSRRQRTTASSKNPSSSYPAGDGNRTPGNLSKENIPEDMDIVGHPELDLEEVSPASPSFPLSDSSSSVTVGLTGCVGNSHQLTTMPNDASSSALLEPEDKNTAVTQSEPSSQSDEMPPCNPVLELKSDDHTPYTTRSLPSRTTEQERTEQLTGSFQNVCEPAKILHSARDGQDEEDTTFILTLYEIPVSQAYPASTSNDSLMTSDPNPAGVERSHHLPSTSACSSGDSLAVRTAVAGQACAGTAQDETPGVLSAVSEGVKEIAVTDPLTCLKNDDASGEETSNNVVKTEENLSDEAVKEKEPVHVLKLETTRSQEESSSQQDGKPETKGNHGEPSNKFEEEDPAVKHDTESSHDSEEVCEDVSHLLLTDIFVPVAEAGADDLNFSFEREKRSPSVPGSLKTQTQDNQSLSEESITPPTGTDNQQTSRTCNKHGSPVLDSVERLETTQAEQGPELNEAPEGVLQKKLQTTPCTVGISSRDVPPPTSEKTEGAAKPVVGESSEIPSELETAAVLYKPETKAASPVKADSPVVFHEGEDSQICGEAAPDVETVCVTSPHEEPEDVLKEADGVCEMVLTDYLVPVSEEAGQDFSTDWMVSASGAPHTGEDSPHNVAEPQETSVNEEVDEAKANCSASTVEDKSEEQAAKKKSPAPATGPANKSLKGDLPDSEQSRLQPTRSVRQKPQLTVTAKKRSIQSDVEAEDLSTSSLKSEKRSLTKSKGLQLSHQRAHATVKTSARSQIQLPEDTETGRQEVSLHHPKVPEDAGEGCSFTDAEHQAKTPVSVPLPKSGGSSGEPRMKSPARRRAKAKVKPKPLQMTSTKDKETCVKSRGPRSVQSSTSTPEKDTALKGQDTSKEPTNQQEEENSACGLSPLGSPAGRPGISLPQSKMETVDTGLTSDTSSSRVTASQPALSPQMKAPGSSPPQSEDDEDEPSRVSEFFISDIFTEVDPE